MLFLTVSSYTPSFVEISLNERLGFMENGSGKSPCHRERNISTSVLSIVFCSTPDCSVRTDLSHLLVMIKGSVKMFWERQEIVGVAARMEGSPKSWRPFSNSSRSVVPYQHRSFCSLRNPAIGGKCVP